MYMIRYVIRTLHEMSIYMFSSLFDIFCMFDFAFEDRGEVREKTCHGINLGGDYLSTDTFNRAEVDALAGQSGGLFR